MTEILNIQEFIDSDSDIVSIDNQISCFEREIQHQEKYFDFQKPSIEYLKNNINKLLLERGVLNKSIVERAINMVNKLYNKFGDEYIVYYSKDYRFIQVHRNKCEKYKNWVKGNDLKINQCKSFEEAIQKAHSKIKETTDISDDCIECQPYLNLQSILKSI